MSHGRAGIDSGFRTGQLQSRRSHLGSRDARKRSAAYAISPLRAFGSIQKHTSFRLRHLPPNRSRNRQPRARALQTASTNWRMTTFKPFAQDVILDPSTVGDTPLNAHIWNNADFEDDEDKENEQTNRTAPSRPRKTSQEPSGKH